MSSIFCRLLPVQAVKFWSYHSGCRALTKAGFAYPEWHLRPFLSYGRADEHAMRLEKTVITEEVSEVIERPQTQQASKPMYHFAL